MKIDRHNCEAFFLDYHEGILSPVLAGEVLLFLEENPDLKRLFEEYEHIALEEGRIIFPGKDELKKKYSAEGIAELLSSDITSGTCEQFYIAFAEGQLSADQASRLVAFLEEHPDQKKQFELFQQSKLVPDQIGFGEKQQLKRHPITSENREEYFIRSVEKDLSRAEEEQLAVFLTQHPEFRKEFELFSRTLLPADPAYFEDKSSLKRKKRKPVLLSLVQTERSSFRAIYYAAAAILVLLGLFFIFSPQEAGDKLTAGKTEQDNSQSQRATEKKELLVADKTPGTQQPDQAKKPEHAEGAKSFAGNSFSGTKIKLHSSRNLAAPSISAFHPQDPHRPVLSEDREVLLAAIEKPGLEMMKAEDAPLKTNPGLNDAHAKSHTAVAANESAEYRELGSFLRKKIKSALGIKSNGCEPSDQISAWDLATAAKNGLQRIIGIRIEMDKVCNEDGNKVEYVFAAGNFQIVKSKEKKEE